MWRMETEGNMVLEVVKTLLLVVYQALAKIPRTQPFLVSSRQTQRATVLCQAWIQKETSPGSWNIIKQKAKQQILYLEKQGGLSTRDLIKTSTVFRNPDYAFTFHVYSSCKVFPAVQKILFSNFKSTVHFPRHRSPTPSLWVLPRWNWFISL
jgi:hypothetical protein